MDYLKNLKKTINKACRVAKQIKLLKEEKNNGKLTKAKQIKLDNLTDELLKFF